MESKGRRAILKKAWGGLWVNIEVGGGGWGLLEWLEGGRILWVEVEGTVRGGEKAGQSRKSKH